MTETPTTRITRVAWGEMEVRVGQTTLSFKDCKVWPGGAKAWDWSLTGTKHKPGILPGDVEELLDRGVDVIVLSRGMQLRLHTAPATEQLLAKRGVEYHIEETGRAVELFNKLMGQGRNVGGVFHSTC